MKPERSPCGRTSSGATVNKPDELHRARARSGVRTKARFAQAFKLTRRLVIELEAGTANPTAETLAKIGKPFGYQVGFVPTKSTERASKEDEQDETWSDYR
ncbi:hypothetical protein [Teichococcus aestuarii]|uniref:hypothetical protein n=1 Tax=Teichococcus aestuarii TaxID=568898 RepID=UPI00361E05C1